jgi:hypothetical protein
MHLIVALVFLPLPPQIRQFGLFQFRISEYTYKWGRSPAKTVTSTCANCNGSFTRLSVISQQYKVRRTLSATCNDSIVDLYRPFLTSLLLAGNYNNSFCGRADRRVGLTQARIICTGVKHTSVSICTIYSYKSFTLHCPLVREGAPQKQDANFGQQHSDRK